MAIRRREKPLTPAEAIDRVKKQFLPYWVGSEPLLAGIRQTKGVQAFPLDSRMIDRPWLILFVDPFSLSSRLLQTTGRKWATRYEQQKLNVMEVLKLSYDFSHDKEWVNREAGVMPATSVTVMDVQNLLAEAFQVTQYPRLLLMSGNKLPINKVGKDWFDGTELVMQKFFRSTDPGLALFPVLDQPVQALSDLPGTDFAGVGPTQDSIDIQGGKSVGLSGKWLRTPNRIVTFDAKAELTFESPSRAVGVVAHGVVPDLAGSLNNYSDADIVVNLTKDLPSEAIHGEDLRVELSGGGGNQLVDTSSRRRGSCVVKQPRIYSLFYGLPAGNRKLTLSFPNAEKVGVAIYGLRFAE